MLLLSAVFLTFGAWPRSAGAEGGGFRVQIVQPGDSLSEIASDAGMTLDALAELNQIGEPDKLIAGMPLVVVAPRAAKSTAEADSASTEVYRVEPGETLSEIADRLDLDAEAILDANDLDDGDRLAVGTVLVIPAHSLPLPPSTVVNAVRLAARAYGLDPYLLLGLSYLESGWQMSAVSSVGAIGSMQLMPETAVWAVHDLLLTATNWRSSLLDNTSVGAAYLDHLLVLSHGDLRGALAGYYQGWGSVEADGMFSETERYVDDVLALVERFRTQSPHLF